MTPFFTRFDTPDRRRLAAAVLVGLVLSALLLVSLRMTIRRSQYALADTVAIEKALMAEELEAQATVRGLRDPRLLSELAYRRGFRRPERVIELGTEPTTP